MREQTNPFVLRKVEDTDAEPSQPVKRIESGDDLRFFLASHAYQDIKVWILQLTRACLPHIDDLDGNLVIRRLDQNISHSPATVAIQQVLGHLETLLADTPPSEGPRRFGNAAFRLWFQKVEDTVDAQLTAALSSISTSLEEISPSTSVIHAELKTYLLGSLGSPQRLDYGTGHELSYLAFLGIFWKCGYFQSGDEWSIVAGTLQPYIQLIRKLIKQYTLEPAGSHGVWGLDDHSFVPYILGSAQLATPLPAATSEAPYPPMPVEGSLPGAPSPASITSARTVKEQQESNFYFAAVAFILDVKRGPFFEHSPYLYNISGIRDGWGKINKGMLKMYDAEVLAKFPVVQHFPFGKFWTWQQNPLAINTPSSSIHIQHQPQDQASQSTKAPWATKTPNLGPPKYTQRTVIDRR